MKHTKKCSECNGSEIYTTKVGAGGGYAPDLLPGAHPWWRGGKFEVYVCGKCGYYQFFVPEEALRKIKQNQNFERYP